MKSFVLKGTLSEVLKQIREMKKEHYKQLFYK